MEKEIIRLKNIIKDKKITGFEISNIAYKFDKNKGLNVEYDNIYFKGRFDDLENAFNELKNSYYEVSKNGKSIIIEIPTLSYIIEDEDGDIVESDFLADLTEHKNMFSIEIKTYKENGIIFEEIEKNDFFEAKKIAEKSQNEEIEEERGVRLLINGNNNIDLI